MATSSSIFSTHGSTPPKSERRAVGGAYSFATLPVPKRLRLLPSSPRVDRSLRLFGRVVEDAPSVFPETEGTGSGRGGSSEGADVGGGVEGALVDGTVCVAFKLTFLLCQRPCVDLLRALGPWLTHCEDRKQHEVEAGM
jgi:hypothetical protein